MTYVIPVVGVILGVVFLRERLDWYLAGGTLLVIAGIWIVNAKLRPAFLKRSRVPLEEPPPMSRYISPALQLAGELVLFVDSQAKAHAKLRRILEQRVGPRGTAAVAVRGEQPGESQPRKLQGP